MQEIFKRPDKVFKRIEELTTESCDINNAYFEIICNNSTEKDAVGSCILNSNTYDLEFPGGPFYLDFTNNGRCLIFGGKNGKACGLDLLKKSPLFEVELDDSLSDIKWLHNDSFFATAQSKFIYIYDKVGNEVHRLKSHTDPHRLEFLRHHFLLASVSYGGMLRYLDVSTGKLVSEMNMKSGQDKSVCLNYQTGIINVGHSNGTVTFWSPNICEPLAKLFCHKGPVCSAACSFDGNVLATQGVDSQLKLWDIRKFSRELVIHTGVHANALSFSQTGFLAASCGSKIKIWNDYASKPLSNISFTSMNSSSLKFCPFDDVIAVGHGSGVFCRPVTGSAFSAYDSFDSNPFSNAKQRQEAEVKSLLDKLPPESIHLFCSKEKVLKESCKSKMAHKITTSRKRYLKNRCNVVDTELDRTHSKTSDNRIFKRFY